MPKLLRAASFRLTLGYLLLFSLSALALLGFVYIAAARFIESQTQDTIDAEITGLAEQFQTRGLVGLRQVIQARATAASDRRSVYLLESRFRTRIAGNINRWPESGTTDEDGFRFTVRVGDGGRARAVLARRFLLPDGARLLVGRDIEDRIAIQRTLWNAILYGSGFMLLLAAAGGLIMSRLVLGRIDLINKTAAKIMTGGMGERIGANGSGDEFDDLAANLNHMLDRIERLVLGMREVSDNIAHDLRTPLNRMRGRLEASLRDGAMDPAGRSLAQETIADCDQLIATFNALLSIARAEAGSRDRWQLFDLGELIDDAVDLYEPLAEEAGLTLAVERAGPVTVLGDRQLLSQALANLIDNALKYGANSQRIVVGFDQTPSLWVADQGTGIPGDKHEAVLERFTRLDPGRSAAGNGLGLSLVKAVVRLHDGALTLSDNDPGLRVCIQLPRLAKTTV